MGKTFEEYLASVSPTINTFEFLINLILTAFLAAILSWVYARYGNALSNRKLFSRNFMMLSMTTMLVITIVKSSLALSLGLVGALSIVRFRTPIKEPEELVYLFLAIAIGLGYAAGQILITTVIVSLILLIMYVWLSNRKIAKNSEYNLVVKWENSNIKLKNILEIKTLTANAD